MLDVALLLLMCSVALELYLVVRWPFLLRLAHKYALVGIFMSILLSWLLGYMFGASGMIVMLAALGSTIITNVIYRLRVVNVSRRVGTLVGRGVRSIRSVF